MRYKEIKTILEYDRSKTLANFSNAIADRAKTDAYLKSRGADPVEAVLQAAEEADPTANKQYVVWIIRQYIKNGLKYEDIYKLRADLETFVKTKGQHKRLNINSDINQYNWRSLADVAAKLSNTDLGAADTDAAGVKDAEVLYNGPLGILTVPKTREASCALGSGTKWCTAASDEKKNMYNYYTKYGPLYIWHDKKRKQKYQFHFDSGQFMDSQDQPLGVEDARYFMEQNPVTAKLFDKNQNNMLEVLGEVVDYAERDPTGDDEDGYYNDPGPTDRQEMALEANFVFLLWKLDGKELVYYYRKAGEHLGSDVKTILMSDEKKRDEFDTAFIKSQPKVSLYSNEVREARAAQDLASRFYKGPAPHLEDIIAKDGMSAYLYAFHSLNQQRFKKGEPAIAKDSWPAMMYAQKILKQPWPAGEAAIKQSPYIWKEYQRHFGLSENTTKSVPEARRNPDKNPRSYALDSLEKYVNQDEFYYISYTKVDKIGINPRSQFDTPIGIYTYPLTKEIYKNMYDYKTAAAVPFAGMSPFIWVLKANNPDKAMWLGSNYYTKDDYELDVWKMEKFFVNGDYMDEKDFHFRVEQYAGQAYEETFSSQIWNVTRMFAARHLELNSRTPVAWNWLMRNVLKYDYAVDFDSGTIHENEPTQAVFFSKAAFTVVEKIRNADAYSRELEADPEKFKPADLLDYILKTNPNPAKYDRKSIVAPTNIQQKLIQKNPSWATRIKNLDPLFYNVLKQYQYIVDEPGLTGLNFGQALTQQDYQDAVDEYGDDAFTVEPFNS
jgi:hypothetical protein